MSVSFEERGTERQATTWTWGAMIKLPARETPFGVDLDEEVVRELLADGQRLADGQGLLAGAEASLAGAALGSSLAKGVGHGDQRAVGHGHARGVRSHPKLLVGRVDLGNHPSTRGFTYFSDTTPCQGQPPRTRL